MVKLICQVPCSGCGRILKPKELNRNITKIEHDKLMSEGLEQFMVQCRHCYTLNKGAEVTYEYFEVKPYIGSESLRHYSQMF